MAHKIDQLLHGYRKGHEQIAGTLKLVGSDADLVTRLSDLSGSQSGCPAFESYLTFYPLPSQKFYAVAKTWPDPEAPRAGCVLTHTLLVPIEFWRTIEGPRRLSDCFVHRPSRSDTHRFNSHSVFAGTTSRLTAPYREDAADLLRFVRLFFEENRRPITWFNQTFPEDVLWNIVQALWPRLRSSFAACTYSLSPRALESRLFDLMFAPAAAHSRFLRLAPDSFVDSTILKLVDGVAPWEESWATGIATGRVGWSAKSDLWLALDEEPAQAKRLSLIDGVLESNDPVAESLIGAIDLTESLARAPFEAKRTKIEIAMRAIGAANAGSDIQISLDRLGLIGDRLDRASFHSVEAIVGETLRSAVRSLALRSRDAVFEISWKNLERRNVWFQQGLRSAIQELVSTEPKRLPCLVELPDLIRYLFETDSELANNILLNVIKSEGSVFTDSLIDSIKLALAADNSRAVRLEMLRSIPLNEIVAIEALLTHVFAEDVPEIIQTIIERSPELYQPRLVDVLLGSLSLVVPLETRQGISGLAVWSENVQLLYAATYERSESGFLHLIGNLHGADEQKMAEAAAAFLSFHKFTLSPDRQAKESLAYKILMSLLAAPEAMSARRAKMIGQSISNITLLVGPFERAHLELVLASKSKPYFQSLIALTLKGVISGYQSGVVAENVAQPFLDQDSVKQWASAASPYDLSDKLSQEFSSSLMHWQNSWRLISILPDWWFRRLDFVLVAMIESLIRSPRASWVAPNASSWAVIINRSRSLIARPQFLSLCVQGLKLAFARNDLPLSEVVVAAFKPVYTAVMQSKSTPPEVSSLFGILDWDKGAELRKNLVDAFVHSQWPPGNLILAAADAILLRKIFKRLVRRKYEGEKYARAAQADLEGRQDAGSSTLLAAWISMIKNPDFYEEWE